MTYLPPRMKNLGQDLHFDWYFVNFLAYKKFKAIRPSPPSLTLYDLDTDSFENLMSQAASFFDS